MHLVLGLRERSDQPGLKREVFFTKNWRFEKFVDIFDTEKLENLLSQIPVEEHYNLYFTEADCFEERGRKLKEQWAIPFDIDDIFIESEATILQDATRVAEEAANALGLDYRNLAVVFSGNGVQFHVLLDHPILSVDFFDNLRPHYAAVAGRIQARLKEKGLAGKVDTSVFSGARLMRLPNTDNRKPGKPTRRAFIVNGTLTPHAFDLLELSGLKTIDKAEVIPNEALKSYPSPDTKAVCAGCAFLRHCKAEPAKVTEPEWYGMLSITSRLEDGGNLSHEYSEGHPSYSHYETEHKIDQALKASGPRTCRNIDTLWGRCNECENYEKVVSPILIRGANYVASKDFGYREHKTNDEGKIILGRPVYNDLIKEFSMDKKYKVLSDTQEVCVFNGVHWEVVPDSYLRRWMTIRTRPEPSVAEMAEFLGRLKATDYGSRDWFISTINKKLNFKNCVLDVSTGETFPHGPEFGFFNVLPFDYDRFATCPTWDKFMDSTCMGDKGMQSVLEEFGGYCISGDEYWFQKALVLVGEGANGKSTFMETLGNVVGRENRASILFHELERDTKKYLLLNKLFNFSEETSTKALFESSTFKNLVSGGNMTVKQLYIQEYEVKNRTKFILACNEMPYSGDKSHGFSRRLIIVKFNRRFSEKDPDTDPHIQQKLNQEIAGICNRLIQAYKKLKDRGHIDSAYDAEANLREYLIESNNVSRFFRDAVEVNESQDCAAGELYDEYRAYCEQNGEKPFANNKFVKLLQKEVPGLHSMLTRKGSRVLRAYKGITFHKEF